MCDKDTCNDASCCGECEPWNCLEQQINDALATKEEQLQGYVDEAKDAAAEPKASAEASAQSAAESKEFRDEAETAASTAVAAEGVVLGVANTLQDTADKLEQIADELNTAIAGISVSSWFYTTVSENQTVIPVPANKNAVDVQSIYIEGARQSPFRGFEFDKTAMIITLAEPLPLGLEIEIILGTYNSDNPNDFTYTLASNNGASLVGTASGQTVQQNLNSVDADLIKLKLNWAIENGYADSGLTFTVGGILTINDRDKVVYDPVSKTWYSWAGTLPHVIAAGTNPVVVADWIPQTYPDLRAELSAPNGATTHPEFQMARWRDEGDIRGWGAKCDGVTDDTLAWKAVAQHADETGQAIIVPARTTIITEKIVFNKSVTLIGAAPSPVTIAYEIDGQGEPRGSIILSRVHGDYAIDVNPPENNQYKRGGHISNVHLLADRSDPLAVNGKGVRLSNLGWNGSFNNLCIEGFHGGGLRLSQVQDSLFNQLEIVDCGADGGASALTIDRWTNLCTFVRCRLESCGRLLYIGDGAGSLDFLCPHFELGDYATTGVFGEYDRINQHAAIDMQNCNNIRFQGGVIIGATLNSQKLKFSLTPDTVPYFMYINSDVTDLHFSDMWMGFGWGHGKFIEHKGGGSIVNCVFNYISSDVYSLNFMGRGVVFTGNTVNYAHDTTAVSGKVLGAAFAYSTIDDNRFSSYYPGTPVATSTQPFFAGQGTPNNRIGINEIIVSGVNYLYDGSYKVHKQHFGPVTAGLAPGTTTLDLWKFDHNALIYLNDSGSTITITNPQAGREVRVQNVSAGVVTINNVAPAPVALAAGQVAHFVYAEAGSSFRKAW